MDALTERPFRFLRLLGPPEILDDRGPLRLARRKSMALLAYLTLEERTHARDSLSALLWPECGQSQARGNLRSSIFELHKTLGAEVIVSIQDRVLLQPGGLLLDVAALIEGTKPCDHMPVDGLCPACLERIENAVHMWNGSFMAGFTLAGCLDFDDWQFRWSTRLKEDYVSLLRRLVSAYRKRCQFREAELTAGRWIDAEPYNEEAHQAQLEFLLEMGLTSMAEECLDTWTRIARTELGRVPAAATRAILKQSSNTSEPPRLWAVPAFNAKKRLNGLIGREEELVGLGEVLGRRPPFLLCLTGTGGVGKTSIARNLIETEKGNFPGGSYFLDFSMERDASRIPFRFASAFGMRVTAISPEDMIVQLSIRIGRVQTLVVADNLEQLPDAGDWLGLILTSCHSLIVVATSRSELGVPGELVYPIKPLLFPVDREGLTIGAISDWPALELLILRARRVDPTLVLGGAYLSSCARLCARLDGIPLALELGAPLMVLLGPEELIARLDRHLGIPPSEARGLHFRHRSLKAVLDWSWDLLDPLHKWLYATLAVFKGSFDVEAVETVLAGLIPLHDDSGDESTKTSACVLTGLEALVKAALLNQFSDEGHTWFSFFQTIHDHACELFKALPNVEELRNRFAAFFLARAERATIEARGSGQTEALRCLDRDQANFEAALEYFADLGLATEGKRLCLALEWTWFRSGRFTSGIRCLERAISLQPTDTFPCVEPGSLHGACLRALGWLRFTQGSWHEAHARFLEALPILENSGDDGELIRCLADLGVVERWLGNMIGGNLRCSRAVGIARVLGDPGLLARALVWRDGTTGGKPGTLEQRAGLEEAVRLSRLAGDPWLLAHAHESLGDLFREQGNPGEAIPHFEYALKGFSTLEDDWMLAWTFEGYGMNDCAEGEFESARHRLSESIRLFIGLGAAGDAAFALGELGLATSLAGNEAEGDFLLGTFASLRSELGLQTLAMSFETPGSVGRMGPCQALEEASRRGTCEWRRGLTMGYVDLPHIIDGCIGCNDSATPGNII